MTWVEVKRPIDVEDRALDLALLAYILKHSAPFYGRTKLQKTTFLVELGLREHHLIGPRFRFYRHDHGPFSKDLLDAYELLEHRGIAAHDAPGLTRRGKLLADFVEALKDEPGNRVVFEQIDPILEKCRPLNGSELKERLYETPVRPERGSAKMKVRDIPPGTDIVAPKGAHSLKVPDDLKRLILEELELTDEQIEQAEKDWPQTERRVLNRLRDAISDERRHNE